MIEDFVILKVSQDTISKFLRLETELGDFRLKNLDKCISGFLPKLSKEYLSLDMNPDNKFPFIKRYYPKIAINRTGIISLKDLDVILLAKFSIIPENSDIIIIFEDTELAFEFKMQI